MKNFNLIVLASIFLVSCTDSLLEKDSSHDLIPYSLSTVSVGTKTSISRDSTTPETYKFDWNSNDKIGLYIKNKQSNVLMSYDGTVFNGSLIPGKEPQSSAEYIAYYPYSSSTAGQNSYTVYRELPEIQTGPFDSSADFMFTTPVNAVYDESDMPSDPGLVFDHHIFSIVEVSVTNSYEDIIDETLVGIEISAAGQCLSGLFSFDLSNLSGAPEFDANRRFDHVIVEFNNPVKIGKDVKHTVYAIVNPNASLSNVQVTAITQNHKLIKTAQENITLEAGKVAKLTEITYGKGDCAKKKKILSYFGDSIACKTLQTYLQNLLGDEWTVYMSGIPGAGDLEVAAELGCVKLVFNQSFELPASSSQKVEFSKIYSTTDMAGNSGLYSIFHSYWFNDHLVLNPVTVYPDENSVGIECELSCVIPDNDRSKAKYYINRVDDYTEDVTIPAGSRIVMYPASHLRDADVLCVYTGTNNGFSESTYPSVVRIHEKYRDYMNGGGRNDFIFCGFHTNRYVNLHFMWTKSYTDQMYAAFGEHMLDYKLLDLNIPTSHIPVPSDYGPTPTFSNTDTATDAEKQLYYNKALEFCKKVGTAVDGDLVQADKDNVAVFEWPSTWWGNYAGNVHPNAKGYEVMANLVYEKMKALGYLNSED